MFTIQIGVDVDLHWMIGRDAFAFVHCLHFEDHHWSKPIPCVGLIEDYETIVLDQHPELLRKERSLLIDEDDRDADEETHGGSDDSDESNPHLDQ